MKRRLLATVVVTFLIATPILTFGQPIPGLGSIVYDPFNEVHFVEQISQLIKQYQMITSQYNHMKYMAQAIKNPVRYRALATPWRATASLDTYSRTRSLLQALNTASGNAMGAWRLSTIPMRPWGSFNNVKDPNMYKAAYANVEFADGMSATAVDTVGRIRGKAPTIESAIQQLEDDSLSSDADANTEIAVLNKINAANMITIRSQQDANQILAALAEHEVAQSMQARDAAARAINADVAFRAEGQAALDTQRSGFMAAAKAWSF